LEAELDGLVADEAAATAATDALRSGAPYGEAMDRLTDEIREGWDEALLESSMARILAEEQGRDLGDLEESHRPDRDSLLRFLEDDVLAWLRTRRREIESRCQVRAQALGEVSTSSSWTSSPATRPIWTESWHGRSRCCSISRR
jgi:hypothetical protein